jgi:hypothetical protein
MKKVETPDAAAVGDRVTLEPRGAQLRQGYDAVLPRRQPGDLDIGCAMFVGIIATNIAHPAYVGAPRPTKGAPPPLRRSSVRSS